MRTLIKFLELFAFGFFLTASTAWHYKQPMKAIILEGLGSGIIFAVIGTFF